MQVYLDSTVGSKAYLTIKVTTLPRLARFTFSGVSKGQSKKLKDEINLTSGKDIVNQQLVVRSVNRIRDFYYKKGYPDAKVDVDSKPDTLYHHNSIDLKFAVDKGERVRIGQIDFDGNSQYSDKRLKRVLKKTKEYSWWKSIFAPSKYQPEEYQGDLDKLTAFYHSHGYKDARVLSDTVYTMAPYRLKVDIKLEEGNKYYFRNITWTGNTKYPSKTLSSLLGIKKGDIYNPDLLQKNLSANPSGLDITSLYMDDGYLFFNVTPVETRVEGDSVDLEVRIFEGPQAIINNVTVTGNTKTHDQVIMREIRTKPGQKFSRADVIRTQRELGQLGYFDPEKMNVVPKPNPQDGTVDIEYQVVEKPSDQIELSGGYGAGMLVGVLGLSLNNFSIKELFKPKEWQGYPSGDGQRLSIRGQTNGPYYQSYNFSFTDPWFGGHKPNSFTFSAFYSVFGSYFGTASSTTTELKTPGITVALGKRAKWPDDYFVISHSLTYEYYDFANYAISPGFSSGYANSLYYKLLISRNSTNAVQGMNPTIYPTSGSIFNFSVQATPPLSLLTQHDISKESAQEQYKWIEYHKWKFEAANYTGISRNKKLVLASYAAFGLIGRYNQQLGYTPFERFFVGGDGLTGYSITGRELIRLRGYANYQAVTPQLNDANGNMVEEGALAYDKFTMELRYPITTNPAATIFGLAFMEAGNAWLRPQDFNPFTVKRSAGVGVRIFLPMFGLLGFDVGYGFDPALPPSDQTKPSGMQFSFYIGQGLF